MGAINENRSIEAQLYNLSVVTGDGGVEKVPRQGDSTKQPECKARRGTQTGLRKGMEVGSGRDMSLGFEYWKQNVVWPTAVKGTRPSASKQPAALFHSDLPCINSFCPLVHFFANRRGGYLKSEEMRQTARTTQQAKGLQL